MDFLVLGGTRFVGRAIVAASLRRGHRVTLFNRGNDAGVFAEVPRIIGDRRNRDDVAQISRQHWDAVIDVSGYRPAEARATLDALGGDLAHYVFISTVSVYAHPLPPDAGEDAPVIEVHESIRHDDPEAYGGLKVLYEGELRARAQSLTVLRPTVIIGPHDDTDRFGWWVRRIAAGGPVPVPQRLDQPVQLIDADDLAAFTVHAVEERILGTYNTVGPRHQLTLDGMIDLLASAFSAHVALEPVPDDAEETMPLVIDDPAHWGAFQVSGRAAYERGLSLTPLSESALSVLRWERERSDRSTR